MIIFPDQISALTTSDSNQKCFRFNALKSKPFSELR